MIKRLFVLLALLLAYPAAAADTLAGSWALRLDGAIVMRFDLVPDGANWKGEWVKPTSFATDGKRFARISLPPVERQSDRGALVGGWAEITFDDPRPGVEPDVFRFHQIAPDKVEMIYVGTGLAPYVLERVPADAPLGPFQDGRVYGGDPTPRAPARRTPSIPGSQPPAQGPPAVEGR